MHTIDGVEGNVERIAALFPDCVTEAQDEQGNLRHVVDFDKLKVELGDVVEGPEERYQFTWPGKRDAIRLANSPIAATLRPVREDSVDFDNTQNLYIEGDNLDVLKLLRETYLGKIKMIYIDPPYNTGNDFVYEDDFSQATGDYLANSGQYDDQGNRLVANTERNGRFHTDWLNMIYPRLKVARDLLTEDGVIFISIDETELDNLRKVCDEIFGASNFIAQIVWSAGRKNDSKYVSISHEYILTFFRNAEYIREHQIIWREKKQGLQDIYTTYDKLKKKYGDNVDQIEKYLKEWFKGLPDGHPAKDHSHYNRVDEQGVFFPDNISWPGGGGPKYPVLHPITGKPVRVPSRGWITNSKTLHQWIEEGKVNFGPDENYVPTLKAYLKDRELSVPYSIFYKDGRAASKRLVTMMGDKVFENPKDEEVIQRIIEFCGVTTNDIVLDFFSGSGTTAHAVMLANVNKNMRTKFILVQLPEEISEKNSSSEKSKKVARNAIALCDTLGVPHHVTEIGKERIRRAGKKIKADAGLMGQDLDIGFRVLRLDSSNMEDVYYTPDQFDPNAIQGLMDNVKADRSEEDLLFQVMLELDIPLSASIQQEQIAGKRVFNVADGHLIATFDRDINETTVTEVARRKPNFFVMRDASAANDNVLDNFDQIFHHYSPDTTCKIL